MLRHAAGEGDPRAKLVEALRNNPRRFFGTALIGSNICIVTLSAVGAHELLPNLGVPIPVATILVDIVILVTAEITPKTLSLSSPTINSMKVARMLDFASKILTPAIWLLTYLPSKVLNIDSVFRTGDEKLITESQIVHMISLSAENGEIQTSEGERAVKVFKFADTTVEEVMTPRADLVNLTLGDTLKRGLHLANSSGFSRLPVLNRSGDDAAGFLAAKDLLRLGREGLLDEAVDEHLRPIRFVPETKKLLELLEEFRTKGEQIALVVNEFGTMTGVVTLEDILEEVLGEIYDEYDPDAPKAEWVGDSLLVPGVFPATKLAERLKISLPEGDFDTAAGLLLHLLGRVPISGERVKLDGWEIVVTHVVRNRITRLVVRRIPQDSPAGGPSPDKTHTQES